MRFSPWPSGGTHNIAPELAIADFAQNIAPKARGKHTTSSPTSEPIVGPRQE